MDQMITSFIVRCHHVQSDNEQSSYRIKVTHVQRDQELTFDSFEEAVAYMKLQVGVANS